MTALTHHCSECGHAIGYMAEPYLCHRTGRHAQPHLVVRRTTPRPPKPQQFDGPALRDLTNLRRDQRPYRRNQDREAVDSFPFLPSSRRATEAVADNLPATASARHTTTISQATGMTRRERGARDLEGRRG